MLTFVLLNYFLIWVAKKLFTLLDLDLLLIKHYKERFESELKNKETDTKGYRLTKLTELTRLRLLTNCNLFTKPPPTRLPYLLPYNSFFTFIITLFY